MAARAAQRQGDRLLRLDGAAIRLESRGNAHAGRTPRPRLRAQRRENVDHQWLSGRCGPGLGQGFLVEKGTPGFKSWDVHGKLSLRASITSGLSFTDCEIPAENVLPGVEGLRGPLSCLTQARYGIGWGAIGAAMACYQTALEYAKTRRQFENKPIAAHQLVQDKLVWMVTEISKAQLLALHVGRLKDQDRAAPEHVSMLKMNNVWMALETARKARDILGANGIVDDYCVMRHMNNLESVSTYEGTHDIHRLIIGERITGLSAFA